MHSPLHDRPTIRRLPFIIFFGASAKLLVDTTVQFYNPFLVVVATGLGITALRMGRLIALRNLMGLFAPFLGSLADRIGHRTVMRASLFTVGVAMIIAPLTGSILVFGIAIALAGLGQGGYTPNLHAYLSAKLPYEKRAMGLGITEYSWAIAGIAGLFASGYLIEAFSWKAPFYFLGGGLILMSLVFSLLPETEKRPTGDRPPNSVGRTPRTSVREFFQLGDNASSAWAAIAVSGLNMFAMMHIMIIHGAWFSEEYGLGPAMLGTVAMILGFSDLIASVTVSVAVDRIGKKRSVIIGMVGMVVGFAALPFLNRSLGLAIMSMVIPRMCFEFAVVSNFPLLSEQSSHARGKVMSLGMTSGLLGATLAGLTGPPAYSRFGVWGLGVVSFTIALGALVLLIVRVKEPPRPVKTGND